MSGYSLTEQDKKKIRILAVLKSGKSRAETADLCQVSQYAVAEAVKWAENNGLFDKDKAVLLERRIAENLDVLEKVQDIFEREYKRLGRLYKRSEQEESEADGKIPFRIRDSFIPLAQELRERQVLQMELQGLYKQTVQMQVTNNVTNVVVLPSKAGTAEWEQMVKDVLRQDGLEDIAGEAENVEPTA